MKIAFLNIYCGVINRGGETFTKELAGNLSGNNEVTVFQTGKSQGDEKYQVVEIPVNWNWKKKSGEGTFISKLFLDYWNLQIFLFTFRSLPLIFKRRFDVVIPVNGGWMPAILRIATWLTASKLVITGQSGIGWDDKNNIWCFPDAFVALSSSALVWAKKVNPFVKYVYIPNGTNLNTFNPVGEKFRINLKSPIIFCDSAFTSQKRIDLVIEAVSKIKDTSLLVAGGSGDLKEYLEKIGKEKLGERFKLISVEYSQINKILRSVNVFTLASTPTEAFGISIIQALATNIPAVVNDDPIRREILGDAGLFIDPTDSESYTKALIKALSTDWGNLPRIQAERFSWDIIGKQYEKLLTTL